MEIRFWGTRGSIAKAGSSTLRYGGNTSCVEVLSGDGTLVILDCGTGAHGLGQKLVSTTTPPEHGHILITHTHWDHIQGFPFFAPLRIAGSEWDVYGPHGGGMSMRETLSGQMQYTYFPVTLDDLNATVRYHDLVEGVFEIGNIRVITQYLNHPALTLGYRLEIDGCIVVYATDHEPHSRRLATDEQIENEPVPGEDERHAEFLADADLVIHDAQYTAEEYPSKTGWGHSTVEYAVATAAKAKVRQLALFHHDPLRDDEAVDRMVALAENRLSAAGTRLSVFAAAEGHSVELRRTKPVPVRMLDQVGNAFEKPNNAVRNKTVVIVIDNPQVASALSEAARAEGLELRIAREHNLREMVRSTHPSLVIIDRDLGGLDRLTLICVIREEMAEFGDTGIVVVSTQEDSEAQRQERDAGASDWLLAPFTVTYIRARMVAWVTRTACRWVRAPYPVDENRRINTLRELHILDTEPEERFDRYTRIAASLFGVPIALVSLVDADRQWFKSRHGLEASETPREAAFCAHAILNSEVMQVPDAHADKRFADNPLVTSEPRARFYAGVPLALSDGSTVGTLCLVDHRPRNLNSDELRLLADLGKLVVSELEQVSGTENQATE